MVALLTHGFAMGTSEAKARDLVRERLELSVRRYGGQNEVFRTLNRYYLSLSPKVTARDNDRATTSRSTYPDLFVPRSFTAVEAATPPWVFAVLGGSPPVRVYARKEGLQDSASAVEKMTTYDWERSEVLYRSIHPGKQQFKYGTGIGKIGWKHDAYDLRRDYEVTVPIGFGKKGEILTKTIRRKGEPEEVVRFDGPWLDPWSVYNFHPDPYYFTIREMRYVTARRWTDRDTLRMEDENHRRHTGKPKYKHLDRIPRIQRGFVEEIYQMDHGDDLAEAMGWRGGYAIGRGKQAAYVGKGSMRKDDDLVEIVEYWDRNDRVVYLANGETPILDGENPFDDKEIPFIATRCHLLDHQFWGYGILHAIQRPQEELNANRNLWMRQGQLNVLNLWAYDESTGLPQGLLDPEPGEFFPIPFHANGNPGVVPLVQNRPLPPEAYQIEDRIDADIMTAIAMPQYRSGGATGSNTATEAQIAASNVEARMRLMALGGELTWATEIARFFHSRRQQFMKEDGEEIRILGEEGVSYERMTREQIAGEYDFVAAGTHLYASKDVLRQQFLQALALIKGDPVLLELTDVPAVWEQFWKMMDMPTPKRFLNPPTERTWDPRTENLILNAGEPVPVEAKDMHEHHLEVHMQGMTQSAGGGDPRAMRRYKEHIETHQRYLRQQQAAAPAQEQPGLRGYEGNVPNLDNAVETQAGLQSRVRGAGEQS